MKKCLDDIKRYIEDEEMSFLIGAGFSRNVNKDAYPLWGDLLEDAAWNLYGDGSKATKAKKQKVLNRIEKEMGYLGFASVMVKKAGFHEAIDTYIEGKTPFLKSEGKKHVLMKNGKALPDVVNPECHLLLKNLNIQNIYTFNYDNALEYFMGDEAKQELEREICKLEDSLDALNKEKNALLEKVEFLKKQINAKSGNKDNQSSAGVAENVAENSEDAGKLDEELKTTQKEIGDNKSKEQEARANLELKKLSRKSYYNVVKDSYDISLSAKRKSIYKIHGSLREPNATDYGFDGDTHTQYIITQEDYDTYNEKHGAFVSMMRIDLLRNRFCIMGVSGGDANFLAWINWVKDVLDKTKVRSENSEKHQSYFIYSSSDEMPPEMALMLRNHFIEPVILKDIFPDGKNDEERIKSFLEYVQPLSNEEASAFTDLWSGIKLSGLLDKTTKKVDEQAAKSLFRLSDIYKYTRPKSGVHYMANEVQFASDRYLRKDASEEERMLYAAAVKCTLLPLDLTSDKSAYDQMENEPNPEIRKVFVDAFRRTILLKNISTKEKELKGDPYSDILQELYNYHFPTLDEIKRIGEKTGVDFVRQYSLECLLTRKVETLQNCEASMFSSPQELVLAAEWLKILGYKNTSLFRKADDHKYQDRLMSLYDYNRAYLEAMKRKPETNTYGYVVETFHLDKYTADVVNAAILLNTYVELGICFAGRSLLNDEDWLEIAKALKGRYTDAIIFYSILRNPKDKPLKLIAQEMMYDESSRKELASVLKNQISSLVADSTPIHLKGKIAQFATEILPAVDTRRWAPTFFANAEKLLDSVEALNPLFEVKKSVYGFVSSALEYVTAKDLRIRLIKRVLEVEEINDRFEDYYNNLVISARRKLKPQDFESLVDKLSLFAEKANKTNSMQAYFVVLNLLLLVKKEQKPSLLALIEERTVRSAYMIEGYAAHAKEYPEFALALKDKFVQGDDFWNTGITSAGVHIGIGSVSVYRLDFELHFNDEQVRILYNDMKTMLAKIVIILQKEGESGIDRGWMSSQNTFREHVMDMRLFMHNHEQLLKDEADYDEVHHTLVRVYEQCFFNKSVYQLIADDEIYKAVRRIMTETELFGIEKHRLEYEQLIGRIIAKETTELGIAFRHVSWAMKHYSRFFNTEDFKKLFVAVLKIYEPYFNNAGKGQKEWNLIGSQKEIAERCLVRIAKTLESWGYQDAFWCKYKRVFNYED